jgi:hypothetical protein
MHDIPFPYVVPLSFGFDDEDGQITIYFHGASEGLKHTLLDANNHVCVETDIFHRYAETGTGLTTEYESIIGYGLAELIHDDEAVKGLDLICTHCGYHGFIYDKSRLAHMKIYRVRLSAFTGNKRFV